MGKAAASWLLLVALAADVCWCRAAAGRTSSDRGVLGPGEAEIHGEKHSADEASAGRGAAAGSLGSGSAGQASVKSPCDVPIFSNTSNDSWPLHEDQADCGHRQPPDNTSSEVLKLEDDDEADGCSLLRTEVHQLHGQLDKVKAEKVACEASRLIWKTKAASCEEERALRTSTQETALEKMTNVEGDFEVRANRLQVEVDHLKAALAASEASKKQAEQTVAELESVVAALRKGVEEQKQAIDQAAADQRQVVHDRQVTVSVLDKVETQCEKRLAECIGGQQKSREAQPTCDSFARAHPDKISLCGRPCETLRQLGRKVTFMCRQRFDQDCNDDRQPCENCPCTRQDLISDLCPLECN